MNLMAIDYGLKRVGLAVSILGVISPLPVVKNDSLLFSRIKEVIDLYQIEKIYVGLSEGYFAQKTLDFVEQLRKMLELNVETVEEAVSTIEATAIYKQNKGKIKDYKKNIDSVAAAVILNRVS